MNFISEEKILLFIVLLFCSIPVFAQNNRKDSIDMQDRLTPLQKFRGVQQGFKQIYNQDMLLPGDSLAKFNYTPEQDSAYFRALKYRIPNYTRFRNDIQYSNRDIVKFYADIDSNWVAAMKNMDIPAEYYKPTKVALAAKQNELLQAFMVNGISQYNPFGLKVSMQAVGQFLGLVEDVSPNISYYLASEDEVEIVVYSAQAIVVQTIIKTVQGAGSYKYTWNGRDDKGKKMPSGDYVAEVRIGSKKFIRKRIFIP